MVSATVLIIRSLLINRDVLAPTVGVEVMTGVAVMRETAVIESAVPFGIPTADEASGAPVTGSIDVGVRLSVGTDVGGGAAVFAITMIWLRSSSASLYFCNLIRAIARS
jgi:hypothetical protein